MPYKIYCKQRNQYFADHAEFVSLEDCFEQLVSYHGQDCDSGELRKKTLADICNGFEWEIHDNKGDTVPYYELELIIEK